MDKIDAALNPNASETQYHPAVQAAMKLGKSTMNKYYSHTDQSAVYRIAMGKCLVKSACSLLTTAV